MALFESTTEPQTTSESEDLQQSDTIEAPAESETAQQTEVEADTSQEETTPTLKRVSLKINDADYELDLPDEVADVAKNGLLMQADYTKSKQQLSEKEKALEGRNAEIDTALNDMRQVLEFEAKQLESPEMLELKEYDPEEFAKRSLALQDKIKLYNDHQQKRNQEQESQHNETVKSEMAKYTEAVPEWLDEDVKKKDFAEMGKYLEENGFDQNEINAMFPAKVMKTLRLAMLYDKTLKSAKSKQKTEPPKSTSPGSTNKDNKPKTLYDMFSAQMKQK